MTLWHDSIAVFGDVDVVLGAVMVVGSVRYRAHPRLRNVWPSMKLICTSHNVNVPAKVYSCWLILGVTICATVLLIVCVHACVNCTLSTKVLKCWDVVLLC